MPNIMSSIWTDHLSIAKLLLGNCKRLFIILSCLSLMRWPLQHLWMPQTSYPNSDQQLSLLKRFQ